MKYFHDVLWKKENCSPHLDNNPCKVLRRKSTCLIPQAILLIYCSHKCFLMCSPLGKALASAKGWRTMQINVKTVHSNIVHQCFSVTGTSHARNSWLHLNSAAILGLHFSPVLSVAFYLSNLIANYLREETNFIHLHYLEPRKLRVDCRYLIGRS
jgi:hypothetical protein